jgi:RNA polymerase sigma-70 factor, ECF subfamily
MTATRIQDLSSASTWPAGCETSRSAFWITGDPTAVLARFDDMSMIEPYRVSAGALVSAAAIRYSPRSNHFERGRSRRMPNEIPDGAALDAARWAALIEAVAMRGDREAFAVLFEHFAPRIKTFMQRSGADERSADELAQETLLAVWSKAKLFDPKSAGAAAWIFTIARNLRIDGLRRRKRTPTQDTAEVDLEFQIDDGPQPDAGLAASEVESRVRNALSLLPEDQFRVIELSFFEEKAHAEIAENLRIPLGTVKSRLRLAMNRLRGLLGDFS